MKKVIIIGAGPAGLAAAYEFYYQNKLQNFHVEIYEKDSQVGGISKTLKYKGYYFDLGGHRFYTKIAEIDKFYKNILGKDLLQRDRLSRIYYDKKFYNYPLSFFNALSNLGILNAYKIILSWLIRQVNPYQDESTFDHWIANRFGDRLFNIFFKKYTEKLWGIPTSKLSSDWAAQRIQNFNLFKAVFNAIFHINLGVKTIVTSFNYPKYGPGMLYEKLKAILEKNNVQIKLNHEVVGITKMNNRILGLIIKNSISGELKFVKADHIISTMPYNKLIQYLKPEPTIREEIKYLKFRNFITVNLIVKSNPFPDQWLYVHDQDVKVLRIQNYRNWSEYMIKKGENNTAIGMEYFTYPTDQLWKLNNNQLVNLAKKEIVKIGLVRKNEILDGFVYKVSDAYPIYNFGYQKALSKTKKYIHKFSNLFLCGRGGLFRYNNQDHSILTGFFSARNIIKGNNYLNVWKINERSEYIEEK